MKVWCGYGSEHSMNLVMIGRFRDAGDAAKAKQVIEQLSEQVRADIEAGLMSSDKRAERFTEGMLELLGSVSVHSLAPAELEQFNYEVNVAIEGDQLVLTTEEVDVSVFLKLLLDKGARIEVYSAHDHPGTGYGRGR